MPLTASVGTRAVALVPGRPPTGHERDLDTRGPHVAQSRQMFESAFKNVSSA
jgi:hypothetical protein